ncbi:MAG: hypothetical protein U9R75_03960 [Candidatus Thermoplasmatota archaeon]|nr:hypothetical protein [Candidatus Thermoplasmatota archaeon]
MLKEVLSLIAGGEHTIDSISDELDVDREKVIDIIQQLSRMGYIVDVAKDFDPSSGTCRTCPLRKGCQDGMDKPPVARIYGLTDKGRRVIG